MLQVPTVEYVQKSENSKLSQKDQARSSGTWFLPAETEKRKNKKTGQPTDFFSTESWQINFRKLKSDGFV